MTVRTPTFGSGSRPRLGPNRPLQAGSAARCQERRQRCLGSGRRFDDLAARRSRGCGRDPAQERPLEVDTADCRAAAAARAGVGRGRVRAARRLDTEPAALDRDLDRAVRVGAVRPARELMEPLDRRRRRVPVRVAGARRHDRDARPNGLEEFRRRRGARPVVRDLQQVHRAAGRGRGARGRRPPRCRRRAGTVRPATSPRSTIETLLMPVPVSGGRSGTRFGSGQSTRNRIASSVSRSPVESRPCGGPPSARTAAHAS